MGSVSTIFESFFGLFTDLVDTGSLVGEAGVALGSSTITNIVETGSAAADTVWGNVTGSVIGE